MKKSYLDESVEAKEGDTIYFDMPPFCSGNYDAKVYKDEKGLYINKDDDYFHGCRDYRINGSYWNTESQ